MDFNKYVFLGINNNNELIGLELNFHDLNKGTKFENDHYSLSYHGFSGIVDNETGREAAEERLSESEYWEDIGYLGENIPDVLKNNIDFKEVAKDVIKSDGWEMTNGEHYYFCDLDDKAYSLNLQFIGCEKENKDINNYKRLLVNGSDFKFLVNFGEVKPRDQKSLDRFKAIHKRQDDEEVTRAFLVNQQNQN